MSTSNRKIFLKEKPKQGYNLCFRLTDYCHADCSYCSTFKSSPVTLSLKKYNKTILEIANYYRNSGVSEKDSLDIHYSGGELLTLNLKDIDKMVKSAKMIFGRIFGGVTVGCSTNIIGSEKKVNQLISLFDGNFDTSIDSFKYPQRTISGSTKLYSDKFFKSLSRIKNKDSMNITFIVNDFNYKDLLSVYEYCKRNLYGLEVGFQYSGQERGSDYLKESKLIYHEMILLYDAWINDDMPIQIEPFTLLFDKIKSKNENVSCSSCLFAFNCTERNLFISANGDAYLCWLGYDRKNKQAAIASGNYTWKDIDNYVKNNKGSIPDECQTCEYKDVCQGGCKTDKKHHFSKSIHCELWKEIIPKIKNYIEN